MPTSLLRKAFYENLNIDSLNLLIKAAETCERYQDVWTLIHTLIDKRVDESSSLTKKDTDVLCMSFKNIFGRIRCALRSLTDDSLNYYDDAVSNSEATKRYIQSLKSELHQLCNDFITVSKDKLIPNATHADNHYNLCIYYKLFANVYRYKCEYASSDAQKESDTIIATQLYSQLQQLCTQHLSITEYEYLSALLCYGVFQHDILKQYANAIETLQSTFDAATEAITDEIIANDTDNIALCLQIMRDNITLYTDDLRTQQQVDNEEDTADDEDYNDGIDVMKYGRRVKATKHNPDNDQDMHDMKADMKRLGLMAQNRNDPESPMDEIRKHLHEIFMEIAGGNDGIYKDVIGLILEYEAFIDLSRFKCIECNEYFGCDVFHNLCSECFETRYGVTKRREVRNRNMEDIAMRIEWDDTIAHHRYYAMINMASLCSMKVMFRILNRNGFRGKWIQVYMDENAMFMDSVERCEYFKKKDGDEMDEELVKKRKINERCITDFGVVALSVVFIRL